MTMTMVMPRSVIFFSISQSSSEVVASRPEVGSSRKSSVGQAASSRPMFTRLRWPPLSAPELVARLPTTRFCWASSCRTFSTSSTILFTRLRLVALGHRISALKRMFSRTVMPSCTMSSCGTKPITGFSSAMSCSLPLMSTEPDTSQPPPERTLPQRTLSSVVFPAPEGPMMAAMRPGWNSPVTPASRTLMGSSRHPFMTLRPFCTVVLRSVNSTEIVSTFCLMPWKWNSCTDFRLNFLRILTRSSSDRLTRCMWLLLRRYFLSVCAE
mmetsp:Transcript_90463/g.251463  ORF Transcript_90463/g.251463 Transcript_90463/m.251463 type:complete len:268 (+) Transcript_90463:1522-2325(+)